MAGGLEGWRAGGLEGWRAGGLEGWRAGGAGSVECGPVGNRSLSVTASLGYSREGRGEDSWFSILWIGGAKNCWEVCLAQRFNFDGLVW